MTSISSNRTLIASLILFFLFVSSLFIYHRSESINSTPKETIVGVRRHHKTGGPKKIVRENMNFWKDFKTAENPITKLDPIPDGLQALPSQWKPESKSLDFPSAGTVNFLEVGHGDDDNSDKPSVLLLHGQAFSAKTWFDLKTLHLLKQLGYRAIAVDMPRQLAKEKRGDFLKEFLTKLDMRRAVIVSPSMSGSFSLPCLLEEESKNQILSATSDLVAGYVPVAPVMADKFSPTQYSKVLLPVMIVYGEYDTGLGKGGLKHLTQFPESFVFEIPKGNHPCYLDDPDLWHKLLYNFLKRLSAHS